MIYAGYPNEFLFNNIVILLGYVDIMTENNLINIGYRMFFVARFLSRHLYRQVSLLT